MEQYKNNSNAAREKEKEETTKKKKNIQPVTHGKTKKKSLFSNFMVGDVKDIYNYLVGDILIPTVKNTFVDMVTNSMEMYFFGEIRSGRRKKRDGRRTPYRDFYDRDRDRDRRYSDRRRGSMYDFDSVYVESRGEAELVIDKMEEIIDDYDSVSITDLYDLVGYDGGKFTDSKYGWTSMRNVDIQRTRDGDYEIILPAPKQLD